MEELPSLDTSPTAEKPEPLYWRQNRKDLAAWFAEKGAPHLGELYRSAVDHLENRDAPGRAVLIAHCVRELANRLPEAADLYKTERFDDSARISAVVKLWREHKMPTGVTQPAEIVNGDALPETEAPAFPIPFPIALELVDMVNDRSDRDGRALERAMDLLRALSGLRDGTPLSDDELRPLASRWNEALTWFMTKVHVSAKPKAVSEDDLERHFATIEGILCSMLQEFFAGLGGVDEFLAKKANV